MMTKYMTGELADTMAGDEVAHARKNMSHFYMVFDFDNLQKSIVEFTTKVYRDYQSGLQENQSAPRSATKGSRPTSSRQSRKSNQYKHSMRGTLNYI
jgi:hypothetical protein